MLITGHQHRDIATIKNQTAIIQPGSKGTKVGKIVLNIHMIKVLIKECNLMNVHNNTPLSRMTKISLYVINWKIGLILKSQNSYAMRINNSFEARKSPHAFVNLLNYILLEKVVQILHVQHYLIPQMALMRK